jgi:hypothetical protein
LNSAGFGVALGFVLSSDVKRRCVLRAKNLPKRSAMTAAELQDIRDRIALLQQASRIGEPLTDGRAPSAQGHITSAIAALRRRLLDPSGAPATPDDR